MDFKKLFQKYCMTILFPASFLTFFLFASSAFKILCRAWHRSLAICSPCHPVLSFALKCFLLLVVDQVKPPSYIDPWFDTLHLWLVVRPHGDPPPLLRPWWGKDYIPCCHSGFFLSIARGTRFHVSWE